MVDFEKRRWKVLLLIWLSRGLEVPPFVNQTLRVRRAYLTGSAPLTNSSSR